MLPMLRAAQGASRLTRPIFSEATRGTGGEAARAIDVHTHVYLPRYMRMLRERASVPRVVNVAGEDRLIILPGEDEELSTSSGRPIGTEYSDMDRKLRFMDNHGIAASVLSLANPWIDFLPRDEAVPLATELNEEMQRICEDSRGRFFGFGTIPVAQDPDASADELRRIARLDKLRGIILGTSGRGKGLDDPALDPVWEVCAAEGLFVFVHPHYGVGTEHFAGTGHTLFLALGFTFETTVAASRLVLGGVMDRHPDLKLLLAHSGGTLPFLAGRLDSCYKHDHALAGSLRHEPSWYLRRMFFDAIQYQPESLRCVADLVGRDRVFFGTDHPFFPPPGVTPAEIDDHPWPSTTQNIDIVPRVFPNAPGAVFRDNAALHLNLPLPE